MVGRFAGAILLRKLNTIKFMIWSVAVTLIGLAGILMSDSLVMAQIMIIVTGLGFSNTFPIIFAYTVGRMQDYANELSSLIILSVIGGAVVPPVMGLLSDNISVTASLFVLVFCTVYFGFAGLYALRNRVVSSE
jgi:fucose permease